MIIGTLFRNSTSVYHQDAVYAGQPVNAVGHQYPGLREMGAAGAQRGYGCGVGWRNGYVFKVFNSRKYQRDDIHNK